MKHYSYFNTETGLIHPMRLYSTSLTDVHNNCPAGHAIMEGKFSHLTHKVDVTSMMVVPYTPPVDLVAVARAVRARRDAALAQCDWTQISDSPLVDHAGWKAYRDALRNLPQQATFPQTVTWPIAPDGFSPAPPPAQSHEDEVPVSVQLVKE